MPSFRRQPTSAPCLRTVVLGLLSVAGAAAAEERSLEEVLDELEREGLTVFYSSALVTPDMRVSDVPENGDVRERLDAVLAPFGLSTRAGPGDSVLIVRAPERMQSPPQRPEPAPVSIVEPARPALDEIIVTASRYRLDRFVASALTLTHGDIEHSPDIGDDALRPVARLPGVTGNGFSAKSHLRGGALDETLIRFDGLRLYAPYHLRSFDGLFSTIDPRVVNRMTVHTGAFPAVYGDRLSGVIDIEPLSPPSDRYYEVAVSFFNASALSAGRFAGGRGEWVASVRRSNLDLLYSTLSAHPERPRYVDAYAKLGYELGKRLRVTASVLHFEDDISLADDVDLEEQAFSDDHDRYAWLRFEHSASAKLRGTTLLSHADLATDRRGVSAKEGIGSGTLADRRGFTIDTLESDWTWDIGARATLRFGASASRADGYYRYRDEVRFDVLFDAPGAGESPYRSRTIDLRPASTQHALYGSVLYRPTQRVAIEAGLRRDEQRIGAVVHSVLGPRLGVAVPLGAATTLKLGWGRFHQFEHVTELEIEEDLLGFDAPERAQQTVVALEHAFGERWSLRVEAYEKEMSRLDARYENLLASVTLLPEIKPDRVRIAPPAARAVGVEWLLRGQPSDRLGGWLAYARSRVEDAFGDVKVPRAWDQPGAVSAGLDWDGPRWNVSVGLLHHSGWPATPVERVRPGSPPVVVTAPRNVDRHDAYRSFDVRFAREVELKSGTLTTFAEISNLFGRSNPCCVEYEVQIDDEDTPELELARIDYPPFLASIGFVWTLGARAD